jgi:hypothetical protein
LLPHAVAGGSGMQPHVLAMQVPPSHPPQSITSPQLSVVEPQRPLHHVAGATGVQHVLLDWHTSPRAHAHVTSPPQAFATFTLHWLPQVTLSGGGEQHVPPSASQTSEGCSQEEVPATPQPTTCPQLFVFVPQFWRPQVTAVDSGTHPQLPLVHVRPPSQEPQLSDASQLSAVAPQRFSQ